MARKCLLEDILHWKWGLHELLIEIQQGSDGSWRFGPFSVSVSLVVSENPRLSLHEDMQELKGGIM
jgi:hypothetical protein